MNSALLAAWIDRKPGRTRALFIVCISFLALGNLSVLGQDPPPLLPPLPGPVLKSTDSGATWFAINAGLACQFVFALTPDPISPGVVYAGTDRGVFKTTDGGGHWFQSAGLITLFVIDTLVVDPANPSTVYAGGGAYGGGGVLKSEDAGLTWRVINSGLTRAQIDSIKIDPENHSTIYAIDEVNLFKSTDGGSKWVSCLSYPFSGGHVFSEGFVLDPLNASTLYVTGNAHIYKTTDAGSQWIDITDRVSVSGLGDSVGIKINPINSEVYIEGFNGLARSSNGGDSWELLRDEKSKLMAWFVAYSAMPSVLYSTDVRSLFKSTDHGNTWVATSLPQFSNLLFALDPVDPSVLYWSASGGATPINVPLIRGFSFDGKRLFVIGDYFDSGATILLDGQEQPTKNDKQNLGSVLIGKKAGKRVTNNPDTKIQVRNSDGKLSQEVTIWPPID